MKLILISVLLIFFCACEKSVVISYELKAPVKVEVLSKGYYSTLEGENEQHGTATEISFINEYSQDGEMLFLSRVFVSDNSRGYLKKSYPGELAFRTPLMKLSAKGIRVENIEGYENFDSVVVAKVSIPDQWKKQINRMARQIDLDRIERRRWELGHLLLGEVPLNANVSQMLASQGRIPNLPNAEIDSVLTKGIRSINGTRCLEYAVYLHEKEPFPYFIWEQHVYTVKSAEPFKNYNPKEAEYNNRYDIAISLENGIPCQENEAKLGIHGMQNPETGDSVTFKSQVMYERYYKFL